MTMKSEILFFEQGKDADNFGSPFKFDSPLKLSKKPMPIIKKNTRNRK